jgi:hypothetical protein
MSILKKRTQSSIEDETVKEKKMKHSENKGGGDLDESRLEELETDNENSPTEGNTGWADAMAKILHKQQPVGKSLIMSKGKTDAEILSSKKKKEQLSNFEIVGDGGTVKEEVMESKHKATENIHDKNLNKKNEWEKMGRVKPTVTERAKERALMRIATRGVVHLFNAVKQQQKTIENKLKDAGGSERKREKVMKSVSKSSFLDMLKGTARSIPLAAEVKEFKPEVKDESSKPTWNVLRDDFMMGAKLKDWDKKDEEHEENLSGSGTDSDGQ